MEFIIIGGLPYLLHGGKAYAVRWDKDGFTVGGVFRDGIAPTDFLILSELSIMAKCQGRLDSIGAAVEEPQAEQERPRRKKKAKGDAE